MDILTWFVSNFSRFKDILDLEYRVLYFSIMEKTHIEIETNIMGKECVLYMQPYDNLPPRLPPMLSVRLSGGSAEKEKSVLCGLFVTLKTIKTSNSWLLSVHLTNTTENLSKIKYAVCTDCIISMHLTRQ